MKRIVILVTALFGLTLGAAAYEKGDARFTQKDVENFQEVMDLVAGDRDLPMAELVIKVAKHFLGTPYVAGTLEIEPERLTVNTRETDCILFVEMCLAMSLTAKEAEPTFEKYVDNLRQLRYRNGKVDGYASRLHYTSEWIIQGETRGIFQDVSRQCGGSVLDQKFNFMSTHPASYKQLKDNPKAVAKIRIAEQNLETWDYWYIPKADLPECIKNIKTGDIIGFNSSTPGLDIAHVAYAYWEGDTLTFIHASYTEKKVVINKTPLVPYTNGIKGHNGLRVIRLK
ncbi:N-acetylmuramoyl-L-alanine amidase-like domain-containing protein [Fibrobacter succinogenes]|uniref:N-acetylmuramoyl-L-alanine amidase-like domain-containing protein n=1 Tax=Fibrobacter succinogenes TaxID=833 RepID=UPI0015663FAD|nr:N-acetylmuramoyl-L-alanine amidase-like domain-containing protein [Fibrobacter succinogenes]